jgi:hypothetical protein
VLRLDTRLRDVGRTFQRLSVMSHCTVCLTQGVLDHQVPRWGDSHGAATRLARIKL